MQNSWISRQTWRKKWPLDNLYLWQIKSQEFCIKNLPEFHKLTNSRMRFTLFWFWSLLLANCSSSTKSTDFNSDGLLLLKSELETLKVEFATLKIDHEDLKAKYLTGWPKSKFPFSNGCNSKTMHFWPANLRLKNCKQTAEKCKQILEKRKNYRLPYALCL